MKQKNITPSSVFQLQGLLVYSLVLLLAISLSSFILRYHHVPESKLNDAVVIEQLHETKKNGNMVVGFVSLTLSLVVLTISTGLAAGRRRI